MDVSRNAEQSISFADDVAQPDPQWYSHAVSCGQACSLVFTSGQISQRKDGSWPASFDTQVEQAMINLRGSLAAVGASPDNVVKLTFYVPDWDYQAMGLPLVERVLAFLTTETGNTSRPLTTLVPVPKLAYAEAMFEIEAVAAVRNAKAWSSTPALSPSPTEVDVVVVGGGFSGIMAGYEAHQAGLTVQVLEARHRIGGRSWSSDLKSGPGKVELGATWINKTTQPTIYALTERFGLDTVEQYTTGETVSQTADGKIFRGDGFLSGAPEIKTLAESIIAATEGLDVRRWDDFPTEEDVPLLDWLRLRGIPTDNHTQGFIDHLARAVVGREAKDIGTQYFFDYLKSGHGFVSIATEGESGAQSLKVKQGTSSIAEALADAMKPNSILMNCPVTAISQYQAEENRPCLVTTKSGQVFRARKVIMAIPTNAYSSIKFSPPLPHEKRGLVTRTKPGIYAKAIAVYKTPWWREAGLVGKFESFLGPICFSWDTSSATQNSLALFIAGQHATKWHGLSPLAQEEALIEHLVELVGSDLASKARGVLEFQSVEWTKEEYIWGAPTSSMGPGMLRDYGVALREPFGHIHIAGGEAAYEWKGYLEGAITSGQRAAKEVIDILVQSA